MSLQINIPPCELTGFSESPTAKKTLAKEEGIAPVTKSRCLYNGCRIKLGLTAITCKCGIQFCNSHRAAEAHNCTYDYRGDAFKQLSSIHLKVTGTKLEHI
jgi:hypothetical protein